MSTTTAPRLRAKAQAATLATTLALLGGGQALTAAPAAAMTNDGKPGVCPQGQIWDFHNSVCMAVEEIHVTGSGPRVPYTPKLPPLGYRPPRSVGSDGPRGGGGAPGGGGRGVIDKGGKPDRRETAAEKAERTRDCQSIRSDIVHWKVQLRTLRIAMNTDYFKRYGTEESGYLFGLEFGEYVHNPGPHPWQRKGRWVGEHQWIPFNGSPRQIRGKLEERLGAAQGKWKGRSCDDLELPDDGYRDL